MNMLSFGQKTFTSGQLEAITKVIGNADDDLIGNDILRLLRICGLDKYLGLFTDPQHLLDAFEEYQRKKKNCQKILDFIELAMEPSRYIKNLERYTLLRQDLNRALSFAGLAVDERGQLIEAEKAQTLGDAETRARELRVGLETRGVHEDVLKCCRAELLADDYFHAVFEATKSIAKKLRNLTGLAGDGVDLAERALGGNSPMWIINDWHTESEKSEQRGFLHLVKGVFGMFRNPMAHQPRIHWNMDKADAEDLLSLASLIHRRLDTGKLLPRA